MSGVQLGGGETLDVDAILVGIGVVPCTDLAEAAGLAVDDGIVVDNRCATADPKVWAIGDCTKHLSRIYDRALRLESVHNAMTQAKVAAANISAKRPPTMRYRGFGPISTTSSYRSPVLLTVTTTPLCGVTLKMAASRSSPSKGIPFQPLTVSTQCVITWSAASWPGLQRPSILPGWRMLKSLSKKSEGFG